MKIFYIYFKYKMLPLFTKDDIVSLSKCLAEYELLPWIDEKKLDWFMLSLNPNAIHMIEKKLEEKSIVLSWNELHDIISSNDKPELQREIHYKHKICWNNIYKNPNAIHLIENHLKIFRTVIDEDMYEEYTQALLQNPGAIHIIEKLGIDFTNEDTRDFLSRNPNYPISDNVYHLGDNPNSLYLVEGGIEKTPVVEKGVKNCNIEDSSIEFWYDVFSNPNAIPIIEQNLEDSIKNENKDYFLYSLFQNPNAIHLIEKQLGESKKFIKSAFANPNTMDFIKKKIHRADFSHLSKNPSIFELKNKIEPVLYYL
jgi:hypothetical protein